MLPAILHALAFIICLGVQTMASPLAGAWAFFFYAGCLLLLYNGKYEIKGPVWYGCVGWFFTLLASSFLIASVPGGAATMWPLAAAPGLAACLRPKHLKYYLHAFLGITLVYAIGLIVQMYLHMQYDTYNIGPYYAWPLMDPNNAACVINLALIPCAYLMLMRDLRWGLPAGVLLAALYATGSKAGFAVFGLAFMLSTMRCYGAYMFFVWLYLGVIEAVMMFFYLPSFIITLRDSLYSRFPIWESSWQLLWIRPWGGLGLGAYAYHYSKVRTETYTGGYYAHNDVLQLAIEMGIPCVLVFIFLVGAVAFTTQKTNFVSGVTLLAVFLQAMMEFQFYVPALAMPLGLALGYHIINRDPGSRPKHCLI